MANLLIIGINGSPHHEGHTAAMLRQALQTCAKSGASTEILESVDLVKGLSQPFCAGCELCSGKCYKGKPLADAFELMLKADGIIIGSPVYFGTISAGLKAFWDRTRLIRTNQGLMNVVGAAVSVGASRFGGQEATLKAIHDIMLSHGMIVVGDGYQGFDSGHLGACGQASPLGKEVTDERLRILAMRVVEVARATRGLRKRGVKL